jgi:hypothetical protein
VTVVSRYAPEVDALVTDRYLESLLAAYDRHASDAPSDAELDPTVRLVAARLGTDLIRVHPSFRFEERLAARLAEVGQRLALAAASPSASPSWPQLRSGAAPIHLARRIGRDELAPIDLLDPTRPESPAAPPRRPLHISGTLASAALTIAGAAIVAWRLRRPAGTLSGIAATAPARDERVSLA